MEKKDWSDYTDEDITDEITLIFEGMDFLKKRNISNVHKQSIADEYLDKLNTLYDEQRKRGTFSRNPRTT
jgi:hypothetical protein